MLILSGYEIDQCLPMADAITGMKEANSASMASTPEKTNRTVIQIGEASELALLNPSHFIDTSTASVKPLTILRANESYPLLILYAIASVFALSPVSTL